MSILIDYLKLIGWGAVGILTMALSLWILLSIFTWLTPVDEWDEIKKEICGRYRDGCCDHRFCFGDRVGNRATTCCSVSGAIRRTNGIRD